MSARSVMSSQDRKLGAGGTGGFKRSEAVTLVLLTGAGAAAVALARVDPSQRMEDIRIYPSAEACIAGHVRTAADCLADDDTARTLATTQAPTYPSRAECESQHGLSACVARGEILSAGSEPRYAPQRIAYFVGATAAQKLEPQPLFGAAGTVYGVGALFPPAYRTALGCSVTPMDGARSAARVPAAIARPPLFNGFGATGRAICGDDTSTSHHGGGS